MFYKMSIECTLILLHATLVHIIEKILLFSSHKNKEKRNWLDQFSQRESIPSDMYF